jgi:Cu-Zn family superoxide dismutase
MTDALHRLFAFVATLTVVAFAAAQVPEGVTSYELPGEGLFPEGIAYDAETGAAFVSGAGDGSLHRIDLSTGEVDTGLAPGTRPPFGIIGLAVGEDDLWAAGGNTGEIVRVDLASGEVEATLSTPEAEATFLNDLVVAPNGDVFVTDSNRQIVFRVPGGGDEVEAWLDLEGTPIPFVDGINLNGIVASEDGESLIVVHMASGTLYRIDIDSRNVVQIDLGGETVDSGDGLVLDGTTLYVVQNGPDQVSVVELSDDLSSGEVAGVLEDDRLTDAATAALVGDVLLVTNAQFSAMQGEPQIPFTVSVVPVE